MKKKIIFSILSFVLIIITVYSLCFLFSVKELENKLALWTSKKISELTDINFYIAEINFLDSNALELKGVQINDKNDKAVINVQKVKIDIDPWKILLTEKSREILIDLVELDNADIYLEQKKDGTWNIEDLFSTQKTENDFQGKVFLKNSKVKIKFKNEKELQLKVNGSIDFKNNKQPYLNLKLGLNNDEILIQGKIEDLENKKAVLKFKSEKIDLKELVPFFEYKNTFKNFTGTLTNLDVTLKIKDNLENEQDFINNIDCFGSVEVLNLNTTINEQEISSKKIKLSFAGQSMKVFNTEVFFLDEKIFIKELLLSYNENKEKPLMECLDLALTAEVPNFTLENLSKMLNENLILFKKEKIKNFKIDCFWQGKQKVLSVEKMQANVAGGEINLSGKIVLDKKSENIENGLFFKAQNINLAELSENMGVTGNAGKTDIIGALKLTDNKIKADLNAEILNGKIKNIPFEKAYLGVILDENKVNMPICVVEQKGGGCINVKMHLAKEKIAGSVTATKVDLLPFALEFPEFSGSFGKINAEGSFFGKLTDITFQVEFFSENGQILYQPYQSFYFKGEYQNGFLKAENFVMQKENIKYSGKGLLDLFGTKSDFVLKLDNVRAENMVRLLPKKINLTGNVTADVFVKGALLKPRLEAYYELNEGSFDGWLLEQIKGKLRMDNHDNLFIEESKVKAYGSEVLLSGSLTASRQLALKIKGEKLDSSLLPNDSGYSISGLWNLSGEITGTLENPLLKGNIEAEEAYINKQKITNVQGAFDFSKNLLRLEKFVFEQGSGKIDFKGGMRFQERKMYGELNVAKANILFLLNLLRKEQISGVSGVFDGNLIIGGSFQDPDIWLTGKMPYAYIKQYLVKDLELDLSLENSILMVNKLHAKQGNGFFAGKGSVDLTNTHKAHFGQGKAKGVVALEIGAKEIEAGLLREILKLPVNIEGDLSFLAQINGTVDMPQVNLSLEVNKGKVGLADFDSLTALALIDQDSINFNQVLILKNQYKASAYGKMPFKAFEGDLKTLPGSEQIDLEVKLDNADLEILSAFSKEIKKAEGKIEGNFKIRGTFKEPQFFGQINLNDGKINFFDLALPLEKIKVDILLKNDKIELNEISGKMGKGTFTSKGEFIFNGWLPEKYNLDLKLNNLEFHNNWLKMPLIGEFKLFNEKSTPKISGFLDLKDKKIELLKIPNFNDKTVFPELLLDVSVDCGDKAKFSSDGLFDLFLSGKIAVQGTSENPETDGVLEVKKGALNYLSTTFLINKKVGQIVFGNVDTFLPSVAIQGEAKFPNLEVSMEVKGLLPDIEIVFSSNPQMSHEEIMTMLTVGLPVSRSYDFMTSGITNNLSGEMLMFLSMGAQMKLIRSFEKYVQNELGLDDLRVVSVLLPGTLANSKRPNTYFDATQRNNLSIYALSVGKTYDKVNIGTKLGIGYNYYEFTLNYNIAHDSYMGASLDNSSGVADREIYMRKVWTF